MEYRATMITFYCTELCMKYQQYITIHLPHMNTYLTVFLGGACSCSGAFKHYGCFFSWTQGFCRCRFLRCGATLFSAGLSLLQRLQEFILWLRLFLLLSFCQSFIDTQCGFSTNGITANNGRCQLICGKNVLSLLPPSLSLSLSSTHFEYLHLHCY